MGGWELAGLTVSKMKRVGAQTEIPVSNLSEQVWEIHPGTWKFRIMQRPWLFCFKAETCKSGETQK